MPIWDVTIAGADVTGAGNLATITSGAGAPATTPAKVGDIYVDTTADVAYVAVGVASSADWKTSEPGSAAPQTVAGATDTLAAGDRRRLTMYSEAGAVAVTVPTGLFVAGDWFMLQPLGAGGLSLTTTGLTLNGSAPKVAVAQNEGLMVVFTASNTISVFGGTAT